MEFCKQRAAIRQLVTLQTGSDATGHGTKDSDVGLAEEATCRAGVSQRRRLGSAHKTDNHIRVGGGVSGLHIRGTPQLCAVQTVTQNDHQVSQGQRHRVSW